MDEEQDTAVFLGAVLEPFIETYQVIRDSVDVHRIVGLAGKLNSMWIWYVLGLGGASSSVWGNVPDVYGEEVRAWRPRCRHEALPLRCACTAGLKGGRGANDFIN